jgi:hypothetical protein
VHYDHQVFPIPDWTCTRHQQMHVHCKREQACKQQAWLLNAPPPWPWRPCGAQDWLTTILQKPQPCLPKCLWCACSPASHGHQTCSMLVMRWLARARRYPSQCMSACSHVYDIDECRAGVCVHDTHACDLAHSTVTVDP